MLGQWTEIAKLLNGRTARDVEDHWVATNRSGKTDGQHNGDGERVPHHHHGSSEHVDRAGPRESHGGVNRDDIGHANGGDRSGGTLGNSCDDIQRGSNTSSGPGLIENCEQHHGPFRDGEHGGAPDQIGRAVGVSETCPTQPEETRSSALSTYETVNAHSAVAPAAEMGSGRALVPVPSFPLRVEPTTAEPMARWQV